MRILTLEDIDEKTRGKIYIQDYSAKPTIEGVKIIPVKTWVSEDGDFSEIIRMEKGKVEGLEDFEVVQLNRSRLLPGSIKGWHLHFQQEDIFYLPDFYLPDFHIFAEIKPQYSDELDETVNLMRVFRDEVGAILLLVGIPGTIAFIISLYWFHSLGFPSNFTSDNCSYLFNKLR